ncbi:MAG: acyl-CoA dehydrogenase [Microbacteriaceae bacterium]|jgi:glutaryl-CoA dehydrogenase|nr:acyl-CoA dehydrogenase [Microbacteriaceae bacterium]
MHLSGYGCGGAGAVSYGLVCLEFEAADSGWRTFVSVQGSLAMTAIHRFGSEEQKRRWLPGMAAGSLIGCFALTEPNGGSDPASMLTTARRDGDDWVSAGFKRWIGLASIADVAVVWAKTDAGCRVPLSPPTRRVLPRLRSTPSCRCAHRSSAMCALTPCGSRPMPYCRRRGGCPHRSAA